MLRPMGTPKTELRLPAELRNTLMGTLHVEVESERFRKLGPYSLAHALIVKLENFLRQHGLTGRVSYAFCGVQFT